MTDNAKENIGYLLAGIILIGVIFSIWENIDHDRFPLVQEQTTCPYTSTL